MSFSFGFNEDELNGTESNNPVVDTPIHEMNINDNNPARYVEIDELLDSLVDIKLSFSGNHGVYKRDLFDIKHQVMTEDNEELNSILISNESDLDKNKYEGGFKIWECSYDLIDNLTITKDFFNDNSFIVEIGSGTSLPSCHILNEKFKLQDTTELTLILSDFNYDVLRLVTLPNILINWFMTTIEHPDFDQLDDPVMTITSDIITKFKQSLHTSNVTLKFISGSWSNQFLSLLPPINLVLTSETIYSLDSMPILSNILIEILNHPNSKALVAAKDYYFGVGGSVIDFTNYIKSHSNLSVRVESISSQLKRSIIEIVHK